MVYDATGNSIVYAIGGRIDGGSTFGIQAYSMSTNTWTGKPGVTNVYNTNGVGKIGSRLYFSGGWDYGSGTPLAFGQTWAYDYANGRLIKKADMPKATADGVSGVISNKLYVLPGTCSGDQYPNPRYCARRGHPHALQLRSLHQHLGYPGIGASCSHERRGRGHQRQVLRRGRSA